MAVNQLCADRPLTCLRAQASHIACTLESGLDSFIHSKKDRGVLDVGATTDGTKRWHLLPLLHLLPTKRCGSMPTSQDWYGVVSSWNMRSFSVLLCHFLSRLTSNNMIARSGLR
jgi:hypothetical protein